MTEKTYTRNIGLNRGKPRLWLEGKILADNGFAHKAPWKLIRNNDNSLSLVVCPDGKRHVAGSQTRPVIDINSKEMLEGFHGEVTITVLKEGWLVVSMVAGKE